ncbi:MAG TPA: hypothetical protein VGI06_01285, partial [Acidimicrobiales bacterium]
SAASFNPLGSGAEHPEALANLSDGNPSTTWATQTYSTPTFGGLKSGDGVYATLGVVRALQQLTVFSPSRGWTFSVYTASLPVPTTLAGWGKPVGGPVTVQSDVTPVALGGVKAQAVLVWITQLPANPPYRVSIGELAVR